MLKTDKILALDIGSSKLVLAEFLARKGEVPELVNYGIAPLAISGDTEADQSAFIVAGLRDLIKDKGFHKAPVFMTVSGQAVFPRFVKLPPVAGDKIDQIVRYEAEQNVPFPINEVVWDYQLVNNEETGEMNVMLVAAKTEMVTRLTDCVVAAGLEPEVVDAAPMALYNTVRFNYPELDGCTMILEIGARSSNLIFIEQERIFSRSIPVAGFAITQELMKEFDVPYEQAEELKINHGFVAFGGVYAGPDSEVADRVSKVVRNVVTRLHAEVNRSINFYRGQQGGTAPSLVLLTGGSSVVPHLDTFFREKLAVQVEYLNPFMNVSVGAGIDGDQASRDVHLMGEVTGLALRRSLSCPIEINLMPPELVANKTLRMRQPFFVMAAVGLVLIVLCWVLYYSQAQSAFHSMDSSLKDKVSKLTEVRQRLAQTSKKRNATFETMKDLSNLVDQRTRMLELLSVVHSCMQEGMWLTAVHPMTSDGFNVTEIEISGKGFVDRLNEKPNQPSAIDSFKGRLMATEFFMERPGQDTITYLPMLRPTDFAREFTLLLVLKEPIKLRDVTMQAQE